MFGLKNGQERMRFNEHVYITLGENDIIFVTTQVKPEHIFDAFCKHT